MKKNVHIIGFAGIEGLAITSFLWKNKIKNLTLHDFCEKKDLPKIISEFNTHLDAKERKKKIKFINEIPVVKNFKDSYLNGIENADKIYASQAWYNYKQNYPKLSDAHKKGIEFNTIINLYLEHFSGTTIGITGSNGKTTTTFLLYEILKKLSSKKIIKGKVYLSGNDRMSGQILEKIKNSKKEDILILEISNRQLKEFGKSKVDIGHITNITENHLSEHKNFTEYAQTKMRILNGSTAILNDDIIVKKYAKNIKNKIVIDKNILQKYAISKVKLKGEHNLKNIQSAVCIVETVLHKRKIKLSPEVLAVISKAISSFKSVPKRLEEICTYKNSTKIINDLSSTTSISTLFALQAFADKKVSLVCGGNTKGDDFADLISEVQSRLKNKTLLNLFLLPGTVKDQFKTLKSNITSISSFEEIKKIDPKKLGEYLIISPAGENVITQFLAEKSLLKIFKE